MPTQADSNTQGRPSTRMHQPSQHTQIVNQQPIQQQQQQQQQQQHQASNQFQTT